MNTRRAWRLGAVVGALLGTGGCLSGVKTSPDGDTASAAADRGLLARQVIDQWSDLSALAARRMIGEYGVPDEVHAGRLVWRDNGPWRRTVVRDVRPAMVEGDDLGIVEQTVDYALTPAQAADVAAFDKRAVFDARSGELASSADEEAHNFLRLNLIDDIVRGRLTPEQARKSFASVVSFEESGKTSPYLLGLRFPPSR